MKRMFVVTVTTTLLLFSIFGLLGLAVRGGPNSAPAEPSQAAGGPSSLTAEAEPAAIISGPVSQTKDLRDRLDRTSQAKPTLQPVSPGDPRAGERLFALACGKCHARKRDGVLDLGSEVSKRDFISESAEKRLFVIIKTGRAADGTRLMPPKGGNPALTDADLEDIVAFIRSLDQ